MNSPDNPSVLIVAAEESSTLYAKRILEAWQRRGTNVRSYGVGNSEMAKLGFERLADSTDLAVVGLVEVVKHWNQIKLAYTKILERVKQDKPAVAVLLDYPGFNLRLAKDLHALGIKVVYYISPQLWAWKQSRVHKVKKYCDRMLVLFPFEKDFYKKHGYEADYVGHPLIDEIRPDLLSKEKQLKERERFGVQRDDLLVGIMPGSRYGEIRFNLATQLQTLQLLHLKNPKLKFALLLAPNLKREDVNVGGYDFPIQIIQKEPFEMIGYCDVILCVSGTATLMVGLMQKPMVIMYRANAFSAWLGRKIVKIKYFGLVNIIAGREISPERLQEAANPEELAKEVSELLFNQERRETAIKDLRELRNNLGDGGTTDRVVAVLDEYLK